MYITLSTHDSRFPDKTQREMASQSAAVCFEAYRSLYYRAYFGIGNFITEAHIHMLGANSQFTAFFFNLEGFFFNLKLSPPGS